MPFSDGCWWDENSQRFRLWYMAGYRGGTALAESRDGYDFEKKGLIDPDARDSSTVWQLENGSYVRATHFLDQRKHALTLQTSRDGLKFVTIGRSPECGDRSTIWKDGESWILSGRADAGGRIREYWQTDDLAGPWTRTSGPIEASHDEKSQVYNVDAAPLGENMIALASMWTGDRAGLTKQNDLDVWTRKNGTWRPGPTRWIARSDDPSSWRFGNIQSCGGICVALTPQKLGFYVSARTGPINSQRCVTGLVTIDRSDVCV